MWISSLGNEVEIRPGNGGQMGITKITPPPCMLCGWGDDLDKVSIREAGERSRGKQNNGGNRGCYSQFCSIHAQRSCTGGKASNTTVRIQSLLHK